MSSLPVQLHPGDRRIFWRWPWESDDDLAWHVFRCPLDARRHQVLDAVLDMGGELRGARNENQLSLVP